MSNTTISTILQLLENAADPQYSIDVAEKKILTALTLAIVAVAEELEKNNEMKKKELTRLYGDRFL